MGIYYEDEPEDTYGSEDDSTTEPDVSSGDTEDREEDD